MDDLARIELIDVVGETVRNELSAHTVDVKLSDAQISKLADAIGSRMGSSGEIKNEIEALRLSISSISAQVSLPKKLVEDAVENALKKLEARITSAVSTKTTASERARKKRERIHRASMTVVWLYTIVTLLLSTLLAYSLGEMKYLFLCLSGLSAISAELFIDLDKDCTKNQVIWIITTTLPILTALVAIVNFIGKLS